jgi:small conductance mechanosensitive channel
MAQSKAVAGMHIVKSRLTSVGAALGVLLMLATVAAAQPAPPAPAVNDNAAEREVLAEPIEAGAEIVVATQTLGARLLTGLSRRAKAVGEQLREVANTVTDLPDTLARAGEELRQPGALQQGLVALGKLLSILIAGGVAEWLVGRVLARPRRILEARDESRWVARLIALFSVALLNLVPVVAFAAAAYGVLVLVQPEPFTVVFALALINASILTQLAMVLSGLALMPKSAALRLAPIGDETAHYAFVWTRRLTIVSVYGYFLIEAARLAGLAAALNDLASDLVSLLIAGLVVVLILQNRAAVANWLRADGATTAEKERDTGAARRTLAEIWHVVAIVYVLASFGVWFLDVDGASAFLIRANIWTIATVVIAKLTVIGLGRALERALRLSPDLKAQYPHLEQRANRYLPVLQRGLAIFVYIVAVLLILQAWGIDILASLASDPGRLITSRLGSLAFILFAAIAAWEALTAMTERYLERQAGVLDFERRARLRTLLPLLRNATRVILIVLVSLTMLSELGVSIAPLLAGAGIAGVAIGFGAQSLVKDVITGFFILIEDSIAVGDVVEIAGHGGIVEGMTIRTIRLRDLEGNVHTVPFGEVNTVLNRTKEFSFALIEIGVAYSSDVDKVIEVLKQVGAELQADAKFGPLIVEPLEVLGLDSFGDSSVNILVRIKTRPIKQWAVKREFHRRVKRVFDAHGIEIPFPHRTLYFGADQGGKTPTLPAPAAK